LVIAFAVLSVPLGLSLAAILGYSTLVSLLRYVEGGASSDAFNAAVSGALLVLVALGVRYVIKWLRR